MVIPIPGYLAASGQAQKTLKLLLEIRSWRGKTEGMSIFWQGQNLQRAFTACLARGYCKNAGAITRASHYSRQFIGYINCYRD
jgi:hypothetical protein